MEEESLRRYYSRMVLRLGRTLSNSSPPRHPTQAGKKGEKYTKVGGLAKTIVSQPNAIDRTERNQIGFGNQALLEDMAGDHRLHRVPLPEKRYERSDLTSHYLLSQGPPDQLVPTPLISLLKHKALMQETRRALELELHCPSLCAACTEAQASLALGAFIRRKKTQLEAERIVQTRSTTLLR